MMLEITKLIPHALLFVPVATHASGAFVDNEISDNSIFDDGALINSVSL